MLENINIENKNGVMVVSSREVAENFGKNHKEILRTINSKMEVSAKLRSPKYFIENTYLDKSNRKSKEYLLTEKGFSFIVMGFTGAQADEWKLKYIEAFEKMKEYISNTQKVLPSNYKEALKQLLIEEEEKERLQIEIKTLTPKAKFAETIVSNEKSIDIGSMAKLLKQNGIDVGRTRLFAILRKNGYLMSADGDTVPTQKSMNLQVMETKLGTYPVNDETKTYLKPMITTKGQVYFMGKFMKGELL